MRGRAGAPRPAKGFGIPERERTGATKQLVAQAAVYLERWWELEPRDGLADLLKAKRGAGRGRGVLVDVLQRRDREPLWERHPGGVVGAVRVGAPVRGMNIRV